MSRVLFDRRYETYLLSSLSEIRLRHPHTTFPEGKKTSLRTHRLDIGTREVVFHCDKLLKIDVLRQAHPRRVKPTKKELNHVPSGGHTSLLENMPLRLDVREGELDLSVDTTGTDESGV